MNTSLYLTDRFYVDEWLVEPEIGRLTKDGEIRQLEPKIMQVLVCLAQNNGNVVRKDEFLTDIWEGVNVTQHVLTRTISEIRRVVGDDPQNPRFIQTIPKIGYRLIANVSESNYQRPHDTSAVNVQTAQMSTGAVGMKRDLIYFMGGILTVIVGLAMLMIIMINMHGHGNP